MESDDEILEISPRGRYSTMDTPGHRGKNDFLSQRHNLTLSNLPQRSRSMMNLSNTHHLKRHSWLLPESPTVAEKQSQLTKRKGISGALSPPPPKTPSVERYLEIFVKLKAAYSGFIRVWEAVDRSSLSAKEKLHFDKCTKKLNAKVQKIEDLQELYVHQEHMREGAKKLLDTIEKESSKKVKSGKDYCKMNLKKNLARLCAVEDEINCMAGSMRIQIIGLIGFARLSPGDIYSVQLKHGYDKLCSKCKVVGLNQKWFNADSSIRINAANDLVLKVSEVRKMNMNAVGEVTCPIANFLSSDGQEFVLPVNSTGTLKLKISALWNPFSSKDETALYEKLNFKEVPMQRLDSLSDSSLTSSPCSTPKTGTLSSMPSLMTTNGTLTSMKISVNGTYLSPQASVIKHSRIENGRYIIDGNWTASLTAKSLPDIARSCENEITQEDQTEAGSTTSDKDGPDNNNRKMSGPSHASSCDFLNEKVVLRESDLRDRNKPRPVTMGPTFTNGFSCQSDYENVVNLINTSILGEKPDLIPEEDRKTKQKQRPKSIVVPYRPIPAPDYPVEFRSKTASPDLSRFKSMPVIDEPDYSPPAHTSPPSLSIPPPPPFSPPPDSPPTPQTRREDVPMTFIDVTNIAENGGSDTKKELEESETVEINSETVSISSSTVIVDVIKTEPPMAMKSDVTDDVTDDIVDNDDLLREVRALLLDMMIKCNEFNSELENRLDSLKDILNELTKLLQETKKPLSRTTSIENVLNSIDSAFDFLSEHQTMKSEKQTESKSEEVNNKNLKLLIQVLKHHLKAVQYLIEQLLSVESPIGIKRESIITKLQTQIEVLEIVSKSLTTDDAITPKSVTSSIDKTKLGGTIWEKHCSKEKLLCSKEQMESILSAIYLQFKPGNGSSNEVCREIIERIQDHNVYGRNSDSFSVFQFAIFISRIKNVSEYFETIAKENKILKTFKSNDDLVLISMMQERKSLPVVLSVLKVVAFLLKSNNRTVQRVTVDFLTKLPLNKKEEAIDVYLSMIEDDDETIRAAVCSALKYLEASKAQDAITYLWRNDIESVRKAAFEALKVVGFPSGMEPGNANEKFQFNEVSTRF